MIKLKLKIIRTVQLQSGVSGLLPRAASVIAAFVILISFSCNTVTDNNPVNTLNSLTVLNLFVSQENLINMYNNRFTDLEIPVRIEHEGKVYKADIEASGAGSRYYPKYSYVFLMKEGAIKNLNHFSISAQVYDKTMMKTLLALYLYEASGFPVFSSEPVFVKLNNKNLGLYAFIERIDPEFFIKRNIPVYELYQVQFDAKFTFTRKNNVKENFDKEIPDDDNYENLEEMINAIDQVKPEDIFTGLNKFLDVEEYLMYHAITTVRHDPDAFTNNFFLYKVNPSAPFRILPWDFDKTFDVIGRVGLYGDNDLIKKLFQNDSCRAIYKKNMRYILSNIFTEEKLFPVIDGLYPKIKPFYKYDPYLGHNDFDYEVQLIKSFITERRIYLLGELEKF